MAEENKGLLDQAKEMLGGKLGNAENLMDQAKEVLGGKLGDAEGLMDKAKEFLGDKAGDLLGDAEGLKKKVVEVGKSITPDALDDKVEGVVDQAMDFLKGALGGKKDK
ncbi:MAG: hypothetical protein IJ808_04325 [Muribaculaceae bacterium]|nr:hypothetical protein [Muribaculaceae bacterium]